MSLLLLLRNSATVAAAATLQDNFDDNTKDAAKWGTDAPWRLPGDDATGVTISEANGRTEITGPASTGGNHIAGRVSANLLNLTDSQIVFRLSSSTGTIQSSAEDVYLSFGQDTNNHYLVLVRKAATVSVTLYPIVGGSLGSGTSYDTGGTSLPAWIRLRYVSSTGHVMVDTAASGASNPPISGDWTNRIDVASTVGISLTAGRAAFGAGTWAITTPTTFYFDGFNTATAGATGYTLTADPGSYAITGTATALRAARTLTATPGTYAITGQAALLKRGFRLVAAVGSYAVTGTATTLRIARRLVANVGSYAVTGTAALLKAGRALVATPGSYALTGQNVTLIKTGSYTLVAAPGSYAITGVPGGAYAARRLVAAVGSYSIAGQATGLSVARVLSATSGAYVLSGTAATLTYGPLGAYLLAVDPGAYALTGQAITLTYSPLVQLLFVRDTSPASVAVEGSPTPTTITLVATAAPPPATITGAAVAPFGAFVKVPAPPAVELEES